MDPDIVNRFLLAAVIAGSGWILYSLANRLILAKNQGKITGFSDYRKGVPAILYFTTPTCAPCRTIQRPALRKIKDILGERIQIFEVDASVDSKIASSWGVLSVPTTFIFDEKGRPRYVNHGVADAEKLFHQLDIEDYSI